MQLTPQWGFVPSRIVCSDSFNICYLPSNFQKLCTSCDDALCGYSGVLYPKRMSIITADCAMLTSKSTTHTPQLQHFFSKHKENGFGVSPRFDRVGGAFPSHVGSTTCNRVSCACFYPTHKVLFCDEISQSRSCLTEMRKFEAFWRLTTGANHLRTVNKNSFTPKLLLAQDCNTRCSFSAPAL